MSKIQLTEGQIQEQIDKDEDEDLMWEDDEDFDLCSECDLPDACSDFGCAIQSGLKLKEDIL
jgi:hypothetical protein